MKILHVVASPRHDQSNSLELTQTFFDALRAQRSDIEVEVIDLFKTDLPAMAGSNIDVKYTLTGGGTIDPDHLESWRQIEALIGTFLAADAYVISTPMWNFGIPYALKYYIDCIVQPGYLFRFNEQHMVEPLVLDRKMVIVASSGSDFTAEPMPRFDFQTPYLRTIFGFVGITDLEVVRFQPTDIPFLRDGALAAAKEQALAAAAAWATPSQLVESGAGALAAAAE